MSSKRKKQSRQGTFALCITAGLFVGLGLGPGFGNVWISALVGAALGAAAAYWLSHLRQANKKHK